MTIELEQEEPLALFERLSKDIRLAAATMSGREVRVLVDMYYQRQEARKRNSNQKRAKDQEVDDGSAAVIGWLLDNDKRVESAIRSVLGVWSNTYVVGQWAQSQYGIGPVISAGLIAHLCNTFYRPEQKQKSGRKMVVKDGEEASFLAPHLGHIYSFAGLAVGQKWEKGKVRPWNARLKTLTWKVGQSFMKFSKRPQCFYGHLYRQQKEVYQAKNDAKEYAETAAQILTEKNWNKSTDAYKHLTSGHLPPAQIDARARRWAVKIFLSHWFQVAYEDHYKRSAPEPFPHAHLGHVDKIEPPGWPMSEGA